MQLYASIFCNADYLKSTISVDFIINVVVLILLTQYHCINNIDRVQPA